MVDDANANLHQVTLEHEIGRGDQALADLGPAREPTGRRGMSSTTGNGSGTGFSPENCATTHARITHGNRNSKQNVGFVRPKHALTCLIQNISVTAANPKNQADTSKKTMHHRNVCCHPSLAKDRRRVVHNTQFRAKNPQGSLACLVLEIAEDGEVAEERGDPPLDCPIGESNAAAELG